MITVFAILSAVTAAALVYSLRMNRELARRLEALADAQAVTESRLDKISRKTRKATCKQRAFDRKLEKQRKKQDRIAKTQEQMKKEQRRQAQTVSKLSFRIAQAEADISAAQDRLTGLCAILDCIRDQQAGTVPGSPADIRLARQAVILESQIATTERKLEKAKFDRQQAQEGLAA